MSPGVEMPLRQVVLEGLEGSSPEMGGEAGSDRRNRRDQDGGVAHRRNQPCRVAEKVVLGPIPLVTQVVSDEPENRPQPFHRLAGLVDRYIDIRPAHQATDRPIELLEAETSQAVGERLGITQLEPFWHRREETHGCRRKRRRDVDHRFEATQPEGREHRAHGLDLRPDMVLP